ncbi:unnamed protein product [Spirodela intermedia]|uniref:Uncharacterized protein n=2 Tax=Spirodela intermedia TaxID=51605 RepID=A0A7I8IKI7_SPIIN|nr:unnamed protein product [Spirodela intermedia]CAA6657507.1 unnamed protein product [Spirodela intermedia]CAA7393577.1 unnamed protein product [Spirodela intermedia]
MEFLGRLDAAVRRVWIVLAMRLGIRKTGLMKLRNEIRTCEYEDIRVMWELLRMKGDGVGQYSQLTPSPSRSSRQLWSVFRWAAQAPRRLCSSF